MVCNKKINLEKGWNHYCSFIKLLGFKNDIVWGVYLGCPCKKHDIYYSKEGTISKWSADLLLKQDISKEFIKSNKKFLGIVVSNLMWLGVFLGGIFVWKTWSSKWAERYK